MASEHDVCPVVGTTNTVLPPDHPKFDMNKKGQVCPVTNASTDHHLNTLELHPPVHIPENQDPRKSANLCPGLKEEVEEPEAKKLDDNICPVVGTATSILPPDHPKMDGVDVDKPCPKTNATLRHHQDKVHVHPVVDSSSMAKCPVVGISRVVSAST